MGPSGLSGQKKRGGLYLMVADAIVRIVRDCPSNSDIKWYVGQCRRLLFQEIINFLLRIKYALLMVLLNSAVI